MTSSRRNFLRGLSTGAAALSSGASTALATPEPEASCRGSLRADEILDLFEPVTGRKGIKIWAPATPSRAEFVASLHPHRMRFCASAFKGFVLCEALRQKDSINVDQSLRGEQLVLDESVWSSDSESFNPPYLSGKVSELTTLEAMIIHSDNTGADMILKHVGADHVRQFIAQAGLAQTRIRIRVASIQPAVLAKPKGGTVKIVRTRLGRDIKLADIAPVFGRVVNNVGLDLLDRIHIDVRSWTRYPVVIDVEAVDVVANAVLSAAQV
jgi:hypothetical protein